jgi:hypothetical protein
MEWNGKNMDYTNKEVEHVHGIKVGSNRQKQIAAIKANGPKTHDIKTTSFEAVGGDELKRRLGFAKPGTQHYQRMTDELAKRSKY